MNKFKINSKTKADKSVEGLDNIFKPDESTAMNISEAAELFKVQKRTILRWLKDGTLIGKKVKGERGYEWRILQASKNTNRCIKSDDSADCTIITNDNSIPIIHNGNPSLDSLISMIDKLHNKLEVTNHELQAANFRNGYLEAKITTKEEEIKLLQDNQSKKKHWFSSLLGWLIIK